MYGPAGQIDSPILKIFGYSDILLARSQMVIPYQRVPFPTWRDPRAINWVDYTG